MNSFRRCPAKCQFASELIVLNDCVVHWLMSMAVFPSTKSSSMYQTPDQFSSRIWLEPRSTSWRHMFFGCEMKMMNGWPDEWTFLLAKSIPNVERRWRQFASELICLDLSLTLNLFSCPASWLNFENLIKSVADKVDWRTSCLQRQTNEFWQKCSVNSMALLSLW